MTALSQCGLEPKRAVLVYPDIATPPSLILIEAKRGASSSLKFSRPLIIYNTSDKTSGREYTDDMNIVYDEFSLDFLFDKK